jgi:hypothetical protein
VTSLKLSLIFREDILKEREEETKKKRLYHKFSPCPRPMASSGESWRTKSRERGSSFSFKGRSSGYFDRLPTRTAEEEKRLCWDCHKAVVQRGQFVTVELFEGEYKRRETNDGKGKNQIEYKSYFDVLKRENSGILNMMLAIQATNMMITLHDLEKRAILELKDFKEAKLTKFEDASLGSLLAHPAVRQMFGIQGLDIKEIPAIETTEVMTHVHQFWDKHFNDKMKRLQRLRKQERQQDEDSDTDEEEDEEEIEMDEVIQRGLEDYATTVSELPSARYLCCYIRPRCGDFLRFLLGKGRSIRFQLIRGWSLRYSKIAKAELTKEHYQEIEKAINEDNRLRPPQRFISALRNLSTGISTSSDPEAGRKCAVRFWETLPTLLTTALPRKDLVNYLQIVFTILMYNYHPRSLPANTMVNDEEKILVTEALKKKMNREEISSIHDLINLLQRLEKTYFGLIRCPKDNRPFVSFLEFLDNEELKNYLRSALSKVISVRAGQDQGSEEVDKERSSSSQRQLTQLKQLLDKAFADSNKSLFSSLRDVEKELLRINEVPSFDVFGSGTFLQFCAAHELELPTLSSTVGSAHPDFKSHVKAGTLSNDKLMDFLQGMYATFHGSLKINRVLQAVASHFGLDVTLVFSQQVRYEALCNQLEHDSGSLHNRAIPCLEWFLKETNANAELEVGVDLESHARSSISSTPYLFDILKWSNWKNFFEPALGDLRGFLLKFFPTGEVGNRGIIEVEANVFVFYDASHNINPSFVVDGKFISGRDATAWIIGRIVYSKNCDSSELELLKRTISRELQRVESIELRMRFLLESLDSIPTTSLQDLIGYQLFITPTYEWGLTPEEAHSSIFDRCTSLQERSILRRLGFIHTIQVWKNTLVSSKTETLHPLSSEHSSSVSLAASVKLIVSDRPSTVKSSLAVDPSDSVHPIYRHIAKRFGCLLDEQVSLKGKKQLMRLRGLTERAIAHLSGELYSEDVHFLLELIQNADDNSYPGNVVPELVIRFSKDSVELRNNERGFEETHVVALCSIGESTKARKSGYIGRKGIGFKSVFKVTDTPAVHSREFHFCFNKEREGGLGYVIPIPLSAPPNWNDDSPTRILLPLSSSTATASSGSSQKINFSQIQSCLNDVSFSVLLFLQKIRRLVVQDDVKRETREMTRKDLSNNRICLTEIKTDAFTQKKSITEDWLVIREVLEREGGNQTEVTLAFPLSSLQLYTIDTLPARKVFAFLPLRDYGFRFVIQADWATTSSRESIDNSDSRNIFLRSYIAKVFERAALEFIQKAEINRFMREIEPEDEETSGIDVSFDDELDDAASGQADQDDQDDRADEDQEEEEDLVNEESAPTLVFEQEAIDWINLFIQFIPRPGQVLDIFMLPIVEDIWRSLLRIQFIPTLSHQLVRPVEALDLRSIPHSNLFVDDLQHTLSLLSISIVHPQVIIPAVLQHHLGFKKFDSGLITQILLIASNSRPESITESHCRWIAWLLERITEDNNFSSVKFIDLNIYFVPLANGTWGSFSEGDIYESDILADSNKRVIHKNLHRQIHPLLIKALETRPVAKQTLKLLGMKSLTAHEYVEKLLLPSLKVLPESSHCGLSSDEVVDYLVYSKDHSTTQDCSHCKKLEGVNWLVRKLSEDAWWLSTIGEKDETEIVSSRSTTLHSVRYKGKGPAATWRAVSDKYCNYRLDKDWRSIFKALGLKEFVIVEEKQVTLPSQAFDHLSKSKGAIDLELFEDYGPRLGDSVTIVDYTSIELEKLLQNLPSLRGFIFEQLSILWETEGYSEVSFCKVQPSNIRGKTRSTFLNLLLKHSWIPSRSRSDLLRPKEVLKLTDDVRRLLGDRIEDCLEAREGIPPPSFFADLQIPTQLTFKLLLKIQNRWREQKNVSFQTTQQAAIYRKLIELARVEGKVLEQYNEQLYIFVPDYEKKKPQPQDDRYKPGQFYLVSECVRKDDFGFLDRHHKKDTNEDVKAIEFFTKHYKLRSLEDYYNEDDLRNLGVRDQPSTEEYINIWQHVLKWATEQRTDFTKKQTLTLAERLMGGYGYKKKPQPPGVIADVNTKLRRLALIPCHRSGSQDLEWKSLSSNLFTNQNNSKLPPGFELWICALPEDRGTLDAVSNFYNLMGIPSLEQQERYSFEVDSPAERKELVILFSLIAKRVDQKCSLNDLEEIVHRLKVVSSSSLRKTLGYETLSGELLISTQPTWKKTKCGFDHKTTTLFLAIPIDENLVKVAKEVFPRLRKEKKEALTEVVAELEPILGSQWGSVTIAKLREIMKKFNVVLDSSSQNDPTQVQDESLAMGLPENPLFQKGRELLDELQKKPKPPPLSGLGLSYGSENGTTGGGTTSGVPALGFQGHPASDLSGPPLPSINSTSDIAHTEETQPSARTSITEPPKDTRFLSDPACTGSQSWTPISTPAPAQTQTLGPTTEQHNVEESTPLIEPSQDSPIPATDSEPTSSGTVKIIPSLALNPITTPAMKDIAVAEELATVCLRHGTTLRLPVYLPIDSRLDKVITANQIDEIGRFAELVAFHYLCKLYDISLESWVSSSRTYYYPETTNNTCDDSLGYDFAYIHDSIQQYVEVKGTGRRTNPQDSFHISRMEWRKAEEVKGSTTACYQILRVVLNPITISSLDPIELETMGFLTREASEWVVTILTHSEGLLDPQKPVSAPELPKSKRAQRREKKMKLQAEVQRKEAASATQSVDLIIATPQPVVQHLRLEPTTLTLSTQQTQESPTSVPTTGKTKRRKGKELHAAQLSTSTPSKSLGPEVSSSMSATTSITPSPAEDRVRTVPPAASSSSSVASSNITITTTKERKLPYEGYILLCCKKYLESQFDNKALLSKLPKAIKEMSQGKVMITTDLKALGFGKILDFFKKHNDIFELLVTTAGSETVRLNQAKASRTKLP